MSFIDACEVIYTYCVKGITCANSFVSVLMPSTSHALFPVVLEIPETHTRLTVQEVAVELRDADWFSLGLNLGIEESKLREIEKNHPRDVWCCKVEVLDWWHQNTSVYSWEKLKLADALERIGGYDSLARRLRTSTGEKNSCNRVYS